MKVIDLLNKIANRKIYTGTHVIYKNKEFIFTGSCLENIKEKSAIAMFGLDNLNDKVEIIEEKEETKPITKESIEALGYACGEIQKCFTNGWNKSLKNEPLIEEDKKIEELEKYYDDDLEEYIVETYINGVNYKEIFKSKYDEMMINKINEIIDKINEDK